MSRGRQTDIPTAARAAALADLGYSSPQIEGLTGVNARTVWGILNDEASWGEIKESPVFKANRHKQKEALEAATRLLAARCLVEAEKKIDTISPYQAVGMYGILRQHERLDAGEPTEIHASLNLSASISLDKLADILSRRLVSPRDDGNDGNP